jgi:hypothetical protein
MNTAREQAAVEALEAECEPLFSAKQGTPEYDRLIYIALLLNAYDPVKYKFDGPRMGDNLTRQIEHAGYKPTRFTMLRAGEMIEVDVNTADHSERFICAAIDDGSRSLVLIRANHELLVVPTRFFRPKLDGKSPNFSKLAISDHGLTIQLGEDYEVGADTLLYEFDPVYKQQIDNLDALLKTDIDTFKAKRKTAREMEANLRTEVTRLHANLALAQEYIEALEEDMGRNDIMPSRATIVLHEKFDDIRRTE